MNNGYNDWQLELGALGALPPRAQRKFDRDIRTEPQLQEELTRLWSSDRQLRADYPLETEWLAITERSGRLGPELTPKLIKSRLNLAAARLLATSALTAFVLGFIFLVLPSVRSPHHATSRIKGVVAPVPGHPRLRVFRKTADHIEQLRNGALIHPGDLLQLAYHCESARPGMIISIDGRGATTLHYPDHPGDPGMLEANTWVNLKYASVIDAAPGFERFFFITSPELDIRLVLDRAAELGQTPEKARMNKFILPPGYSQSSILLIKTP